jgi:hypothetical protein
MSPRLQQIALLLAAIASIVLLVGFFDRVVGFAACGVMVAAAVLTAPAGRGPEGGWWRVLAIGAVLASLGAGLAELSEGAGGLGIVLGGVAVLAASVVGMPARVR